jgi:glycosyltransferase involved in cell wall biosynthesis
MMRIAVTGLRGIPGVMGGVETHCEELLPRVKRLAPDAAITVFARGPYVPPGASEHKGVRIVPVASPRSRSFEAIIATFNSVLAARRDGAKLVHIHAIGPALLTPLARMLGLKVVVTHHGEDYRRAKWGFVARQMLRLGERFALRSADRLIAVSPSLTERLRAAYPPGAERIRFIPNGVPELPAGRGDALTRLGLTRGNYILAVGRLVPEKGLHDLIDAHQRAGDPRTLVIVGGADHESAYAAKLRTRESQQVRFAGLQDRATVRELFENAALFVMPSYHEGLPIAALEAASCATPMLLSDIQPNRDLGLPPHHYFPVGDVSALTERLGRPAAGYAVEREAFLSAFDWDRISERTLEVYREVA